MKMIVMGFDGCTMKLVEKWKDKLPAFSRLMNQNKLGTLYSTNPPHTAPGWTSAFTGVNSGKHGIYQFWDTQAPQYMGKFMRSSDLNVLSVWEMLNQLGYRTGVLNVPMTYPPKELDGFILTWPLNNTLRYAYPDGLLIDIAKNGGHYISDLSTMFQGDYEDYAAKAIKITRKRLITLKHLIQEYQYEFYISVFTEMDRVSHFYWNFMDEGSSYYDDSVAEELALAIEAIYQEADTVIGDIIDSLDEDTLLLVLSDHGFCRGNLNFYVQSYLLETGALALKESEKDLEDTKEGALFDVKVDSWLECLKDGKRYEIDWKKTTAFMSAPGSYGVNINLSGRQENGCVKKEEYQSVRNHIIQELKKVVHPDTKEPLFKEVLPREEVYTGDVVDKAPDIIIVPYDYGIMVHHEIKPGTLFGEPEQKGMHDMDGIFALYGNEIEHIFMPKEASIVDIAPTILSYFGIEIPEYFEGKPIYDFNRSSQKKIEKLSVCNASANTDSYTADEVKEAKRKLKALGYL